MHAVSGRSLFSAPAVEPPSIGGPIGNQLSSILYYVYSLLAVEFFYSTTLLHTQA